MVLKTFFSGTETFFFLVCYVAAYRQRLYFYFHFYFGYISLNNFVVKGERLAVSLGRLCVFYAIRILTVLIFEVDYVKIYKRNLLKYLLCSSEATAFYFYCHLAGGHMHFSHQIEQWPKLVNSH